MPHKRDRGTFEYLKFVPKSSTLGKLPKHTLNRFPRLSQSPDRMTRHQELTQEMLRGFTPIKPKRRIHPDESGRTDPPPVMAPHQSAKVKPGV